MTTAQNWFIVGGVLNFFIGMLVAYALYWARVANRTKPAQRYAIVSHRITLMNGFFLLGLALAIEQTGFTPQINTWLAIGAVIATLTGGGRNIVRWAQGIEDEFAEGSELVVRLIGVGNLVNLVVVSAILYGVTRTALGLY